MQTAPAATEAVSRDITALVVASDEATLASQMPGRIKRINATIGHAFAAGAVLVEFDCSEQEAKLRSAQAESLGARETHLAKLRLQSLGAAGELEVTLAAASAEKARAQVSQQEAQMQFCHIRAPYAGRVVRLKANAFESVAQGQPIMEVVSGGPLRVSIHVPTSWLPRLKVGTPVRVQFAEAGNRALTARVARLNGRVDGVSQSIEIQAMLDGAPGALLPGMIGQASFPSLPR